jgi:UDP-N-acetylmuramoylalanine--D-glutamate ligase
MKDWTGLRILIIGGARQGLAAARFLARNGAVVTLNDKRPLEQMEAARQTLAGLPIRWVLGEHPLGLLDETDQVCISGGVPLTLPIVAETIRRGLVLTNDSQIFMEAVSCPVIAITGSAGKTTTTTLVGRMAQAAHPGRVWIGGNIGLPLIDYLDEIQSGDRVVLELSSFQLEQMTRSPQVAAVLNITPNHLDRHGTMEAYAAAKARILSYQTPGDIAVLGREDPGAWALAGQIRGKLVSFGLNRPVSGQMGTYFEDGQFWLQTENGAQALLSDGQVLLRGQHNRVNVLAACAIAAAAGFTPQAMAAAVDGFGGVAHRLEWVRTFKGANWYNGSIATAPERTMADIRAFDEPLVLLLGGRDKDLPWESLADLIRQRVDHVVVFGEAAAKIMAAIGPLSDGQRPYTLMHCAGLHAAIEAAAEVASPGDVVLLSPGGTSYDEFKDFEERGERYREWVKQLL